jgi:hypothetical protein
MKRHISVYIPRDEDPTKADPIIAAIQEAGYQVEDIKSIHHSTLSKWGREMNDNGEVVPEELFTVNSGRIAEIK